MKLKSRRYSQTSYDSPRPNGWHRMYIKARNAFARCTNPRDLRYEDYGGRGICVKFESMDTFIDYLLTLPGCLDTTLVLDRENNDGHYEPGNLRFVTRTESAFNRRRIKYINVPDDYYRNLRVTSGVYQSDISAATGIGRPSIRRFECGLIVSKRIHDILVPYYESLKGC